MAEIGMERTHNNVLPWLLGLALLALVILGMVVALADNASGADTGGGAREVGSAPEKKKDETPRRLQQWALAVQAGAAGPARAA